MVDEKPTESKEGSGCRCPLPYVVSHIHEVSLFLDDQTDGNRASISYFARFTFVSMLCKCIAILSPSVIVYRRLGIIRKVVLGVSPKASNI